MIDRAIEPKTKGRPRSPEPLALQRLAEEDPTFQVRTDEETGQTIISGMGELHLEVIVDRLQREFNVAANVGKPQVAYRETITKAVRSEGRFIRQTGGHGQYGHIVLEIEPLERGGGFSLKARSLAVRFPRSIFQLLKQALRKQCLPEC